MIVRTYGRRNRDISRTCSSDTSNDVVSQESESQDFFSLPLSTQESSSHCSPFDFEPKEDKGGSLYGAVPKPKRSRHQKADPLVFLRGTATLMETQEFGEMMEHVDEVNFALDGLRKGQPLRIRRASLLSLLSICATASQRRLLRAQGLAKTILDAILGLSCDDLPSNLAVAALFYTLTGDGQDDHLLESPTCIRFLIKLIKPIISTSTVVKEPKIGFKLLAIRKVTDMSQDTTKRLDSSATAIVTKVQEILVSCKEIKPRSDGDDGNGRPELSPKWIALLAMEKACLSKISLEDTSGTVRKTGSNFKEKLREVGGLDAVFEVARSCHSVMEGWKEKKASSSGGKNGMDLESLVLLLKCLKIMENATFLSKDNQDHLLGMKIKLGFKQSMLSFTELVINVIKILSGLYLLKSSAAADGDSCYNLSNDTCSPSEVAVIANNKASSNEIICISSSQDCFSMETTSEKSANLLPNSPWLSISRLGYSVSSSETATISMNDTDSTEMRANSSIFGSCSQRSKSSNSGTTLVSKSKGSKENLGVGRGANGTDDVKFDFSEDSLDPYAFDEDEFRPSKWDLLYGTEKTSRTQRSGVTYREIEDVSQPQFVKSQQESSNGKSCQEETSNCEQRHSRDASCSGATDGEESRLLADCLLTAVKVLMNLTNENPLGCHQIASCGGLETLSALIAGHFPIFSSSSFLIEMKQNTSIVEIEHQRDLLLNDQEMEFLVAILGLLVNMVEKDGCNRSRLASASVLLHGSEGETHYDVIPLLCSIFLAHRGAGEAAEEGKAGPWDDEAAMIQGEKEAEKMIVEAYAALLLAFLSTESRSTRDAIAECLPGHKLAILVPVLDRFVAFHLSLNMISPETHKVVSEVIESCRTQ